MATLTLTPTPEPNNWPPRIKLDVTDTGLPAITEVTVNRLDTDGRTRPVRTPDGGPMPLSGGAATLYDNEVPYGTTVTYSIVEGNASTADSSVASDQVWLVHLGVPSRSQPLLVTDARERTRPVDRGVFPILGRDDPIVNSGGRRSRHQGTLGVRTKSDEARRALDQLLDDSQSLLLNVPASKNWGIDTAYVSVGELTERRTVPWGSFPWREWSLPYIVTARPAGGTRATVIHADYAAEYALWSNIPAGTTWAQIAAGA